MTFAFKFLAKSELDWKNVNKIQTVEFLIGKSGNYVLVLEDICDRFYQGTFAGAAITGKQNDSFFFQYSFF